MASSRKAPDPEFVLRTSSCGITCLSDGLPWQKSDTILSGSANGIISLWNMNTKRTIKIIKTNSTNSILKAFQFVNGKILSHDRDGAVTIWNLDGPEAEIESSFTVYQFGFCPVSVLHIDEDVLIGYQASSDSQFDVVDLHSRKLISQLKPDEKLGMVMHGKIFEDKETKDVLALIGYEDGSVALWDVGQRRMKKRLKVHSDAVMCLDLDTECSKAIVGSADNMLIQLGISKEQDPLLQIRSVEIKSHGVAAVKIRPDCKIVVAGCWDGKVRVFGWKKLKPLAVLQYHSETVNCITFTASNGLVCGSKDGKMSIWSIY